MADVKIYVSTPMVVTAVAVVLASNSDRICTAVRVCNRFLQRFKLTSTYHQTPTCVKGIPINLATSLNLYKLQYLRESNIELKNIANEQTIRLDHIYRYD